MLSTKLRDYKRIPPSQPQSPDTQESMAGPWLAPVSARWRYSRASNPAIAPAPALRPARLPAWHSATVLPRRLCKALTEYV